MKNLLTHLTMIFLVLYWENVGFCKAFYHMDRDLLKDQLSCVINGGTTTQYFNLERRSRQGDSISAYLVILMLEILFLFIETSWNKRRRDISVLYSLYCLCRWCNVLSERFTTHWIPSWNIHCFFHFFRIENKSNKMRNSGNRSPEIGSLCYEMHWPT